MLELEHIFLERMIKFFELPDRSTENCSIYQGEEVAVMYKGRGRETTEYFKGCHPILRLRLFLLHNVNFELHT